MKTFIALLLGCLTLSAATLYPVMSTTTNRTIAPTSFGLQLLTNANAPELLTLISAAPSSNAVTLTGTQTISGAKSFTNAGNVFVGDGSGLTGVGGGGTNSPTLNGTNEFTGPNTFAAASFFPQNKIHERQLFATGGIYIDAVYTNASNSTLTNNGGSSVGLQIFQVTLPPLLSSNSLVVLDYSTANTNANASSAFGYVYIGAATNFIYDLTFATTAATRNHIVASALFSAWSQTQQFSRAGFTALNTAVTPVAFADTSTNWVMTFVISTTASHTNLMISRITISERTGSP